MKFDFVLKLFKENAARWIKDLLRSIKHYISIDMNLSRCCRESINGKNTSMDRKAVKKLLARQKLSQ